jgi:transcription elongation factor Elf1
MNCPHCTNGVVSVDENDMIVLSACTECSGYGHRPSFTELQVDHTRPISHAEYIAGYREWKAKRT